MTKAAAGISSPETMNALGILGKMLNIASIYGMNHPSVSGPMKEAHQVLSNALNREKKVTLGLFNKTLTINDKMISDYTVHLRALERKFIALNIPHLVFRKGITFEELSHLVNALCTAGSQPGASIKEQLDEAGLDHIKADTVEYVAQHEGEHLVGDDEGGQNGVEGDGDGDGDEEEQQEEEDVPSPQIQIEQIVAFLKGDPSSSSEPPSDDLQEMLSDPEKLGQLIMESVSVRQSVQSLDDSESLADIVVGCLRRTYEGLAQQKKFQSARGKASLHKAMLLLEKTVVDKIRNAVGEEQPEVDEQILEALREAEEQRQVEILAARFAEQHKKMTRTELDVLNYIREHGEEKARAILDSEDIPEQEWNRLMIKSRNAATGSASSGTGAGGSDNGEVGGNGDNIDMGALAIVLDKLETIMHLDNTPPEIIQSTLEDVRENVKTATANVEKQVEKLENQVEQHEEDSAKPPEERKSQRSRADILLEISQLALKLSQPLTVITASIEAALLQTSQPDLQRELLEMANESGQRMKQLMKRLTCLVGYPSMKEADIGIPG